MLHLLLAALLAAGQAGELPQGKARLLDLSGRPVDPLAKVESKAVVFIFVSVDCPISNSYSPELKRLQARFSSSGIAFRLVYPIADQTGERIREHLREYELPFEALRDPDHSLAGLAQARVTPEAAVYLPGKGWMYRGRIDDRHVDFGKKRPAATQHDLRDVLAAIAEGREIKPTVTRAVGCYISSTP